MRAAFLPVALTLVVVLSVAAPAGAAGERPRGLPLTVTLPGDAKAAASGPADRDAWIVAARPGADARRVARRHGARPVVAGTNVFVVRRARARALAGALGDRIAFAEPDVLARPLGVRAFPSAFDPLTVFQWWRAPVVASSLTPPAVRANSPRLGIVYESPDTTHPDLAGGHVRTLDPSEPVKRHGTAVAGVASAADNNVGTVGIWPGMRVLAAPSTAACSQVSAALDRASRAKVAVMSMSYGFPLGVCQAHLAATQRAFGRGVVLVAAAGNEYQDGNDPISPAADPHVLSVAAVDEQLRSADFSNENQGIALSAPGVRLVTSVIPSDDRDGIPDGYDRVSGTSFSSPIAGALAAWLRARRPGLRHDQVAALLKSTARDLGPRGWDRSFGWGLVNLARALRARTPARDRLEPNDDIEWVDGSVFRADPPLLRASARRASTRGTLDEWEDPADVYRIEIPARRRVEITLAPRVTDSDLYVYGTRATTIASSYDLLGSSVRDRLARDRVIVRNRGRTVKRAFVGVVLTGRTRKAEGSYGLSLLRR